MKTLLLYLSLFVFMGSIDLSSLLLLVDKSQSRYLESDELGSIETLRIARGKLMETIGEYKVGKGDEVFLIESISLESFNVLGTLLINSKSINYMYNGPSDSFELLDENIYSDFFLDNILSWKIDEIKGFEGKTELISPKLIFLTRVKKTGKKIDHEVVEEFIECYYGNLK